MRKIYVSELVSTPEQAEVHFILKADRFISHIRPGSHVCLEEHKHLRTFEFAPDLIETWPDVLNVAQDQIGNVCFLWASEVANNRDGVVAQSTRKRILDMMRRYSMSVALCPDRTWELYANQRCYVEAEPGVAFEVIAVGWWKAEWVFRQYVPAIVQFLDYKEAKMRALGRLRQHDSLNALELQVDLLCEVVNAIATGGTVPDWWPLLHARIQANKANSVFPNTMPECIGFIEQEKSYVREIQRNYFAELGEIYG